jgi:hypothetical protein
MLAIVAALVTYQLATFSVDDLRHFVHSQVAHRGFSMMICGVQWAVAMSGLSAFATLFVPALPEQMRPQISLLLFGIGVSHLAFAIRASFDFFGLKLTIAEVVEQSADDERAPKDQLSPSQFTVPRGPPKATG